MIEGSLFLADIHMTDNPRDEYRWTLFDYLVDWIDDNDFRGTVYFLGDSTEAKDNHASWLVNRFVENMRRLAKHAYVVILAGNHDFIDPSSPFFMFLDDDDNNIQYISKPTIIDDAGIGTIMAIPADKSFSENFKLIPQAQLDGCDYIICHQTFENAAAENGSRLSGISPTIFKRFKGGKVYSGDIHVPQDIHLPGCAPIKYIGAPYRVKFGDFFVPRSALLLVGGKENDIHFSFPNKHTVTIHKISDLDKYDDIRPGDQVKVVVELLRKDFPDWEKMKNEIKTIAAIARWNLFGPELRSRQMLDEPVPVAKIKTPEELIRERADRDDVDDDVLEAGLELFNG